MIVDNQATADWSEVTELLAALRQEVARLSGRVAALEASHAVGGEPKKDEVPRSAELDEELVVVIAAAIAAFLGKKPRIRQIRLVGTATWAEQGRVTIQTSHALAVGHTRSER